MPQHTSQAEHNFSVFIANYTCSYASSSSSSYKSHNYTKVKNILRRFMPSHFDNKYRNYCWMSSLNLTLLQMSLPDLRRFYNNDIINNDKVNELIRKVTGGKDSKRLVCLPSVLMAGFPKSGSTYIYNLLKLHPSIRPGRVKEPHFWTNFPFQNKDNYDTLAVLTYLANFNEGSECSYKDSSCITIDASQSLVWNTRAAQSDCTIPQIVKELFPKVKFIINMRNPTSRTYSDFYSFSVEDCSGFFSKKALLSEVFDLKMKSETKRFSACLQSHPMSYCTQKTLNSANKVFKRCGELRLASSIYVAHIKRWLGFFPREQFLFVRLEDLVDNLYDTMKEIWSFLGVRILSKGEFEQLREKVKRKLNEYEPMQDSTRQLLDDFFYPFNKDLAEVIDDSRFTWRV